MLSSRTRALWSSLTSARANLSTSSTNLHSHYDVLGITPHATQSDIKSAYYKLTMQYHPDKNKSESAKDKFRDITEAYEVLGNYKSRRMYDRGMRPGDKGTQGPVHKGHTSHEDPQAQFYKSRLRRSQPPTTTGRTPIYDFDEWSKAHYGSTLHRRSVAKSRYDLKVKMKLKERNDIHTELLMATFGFIILVLFMLSYTDKDHRNYDTNRISAKHPKSPNDSERISVNPLGEDRSDVVLVVEAKQS